MYGQRLEDLKAGILDLDCLSIELESKDGEESGCYQGAGRLLLDEDGQLQLTLYDTTHTVDLQRFSGNVKRGSWLPKSEYYDMRAFSMSGEIWNATDCSPGTEVHVARDGAIVRAHLDSIRSESDSDPGERDWTWLYFADRIKMPTNIATIRTVRESDETKPRQGFERNVWKISDQDWEICFRRGENGLSVEVLSPRMANPRNLCRRVEETIWFALGQPLAADVVRYRWGGRGGCLIRSRGRSAKLPSALPPYAFQFTDTAEVLGSIFLSYLRFAIGEARDRYHPVSIQIRKVLEAERRTIEEQALALCVAIEGLVNIGFIHHGHASEETLKAVSSLETVLFEPLKNSILRERVKGFVSSVKRANARNALHSLAEKGMIAREQLQAWEDLRHDAAHGKEYALHYREIAESVFRLRVLMNSLILQLIGYDGPYTDYGTLGWPTKQSRNNNLFDTSRGQGMSSSDDPRSPE